MREFFEIVIGLKKKLKKGRILLIKKKMSGSKKQGPVPKKHGPVTKSTGLVPKSTVRSFIQKTYYEAIFDHRPKRGKNLRKNLVFRT